MVQDGLIANGSPRTSEFLIFGETLKSKTIMGNFNDWLKRVANTIGDFFTDLWDAVTDWWEDGMEWISKALPQILNVTQAFKRFLESPVDNVFFSQYLGVTGYKKAERIILKGLEKANYAMGEIIDINACVSENDSDADKIDCISKELKENLNSDLTSTFVYEFGVGILKELLENKGLQPDEVKVRNIVQAGYDSMTLDK